MPLPYLVAVPCNLQTGLFSSERVFSLTLADGNQYQGIAPRHFCWNANGVPLGEKEPNQEADGFVAGRVIEYLDDDQVAVEVPDGEVVAIEKNRVRSRPTVIRPPNAPTFAEP